MALFFHDIYLFGDPSGAAVWRREHQAEHTQFVQIFLAQASPKPVDDFDFMSWQDDSKPFLAFWLNSHETVHEQLRALTGVSGVDLSEVDLTKPDEFYEWLDVHRSEHILLRTAMGLI